MTKESLRDVKIHFSLHSLITSLLVFIVSLNFYFITPPIKPILDEIGKGIPNYLKLYYSVPAYLWPGFGTIFAILILVKDKLASDKFSFKFDLIAAIFVLLNFNVLLVGTFLVFIDILKNIG